MNLTAATNFFAASGSPPPPPPAPSIASIAPGHALVGASVMITGSGFGSSQGASTVKFNGVTAFPSAWSNTSITVPVPVATSGNVVVRVGGVDSSGFAFTVDAGSDMRGWQTLSTRGNAYVAEILLGAGGKEAATKFRAAAPHGADTGFQIGFQGFIQAFNSPNTTDDIIILAAAIWILSPDNVLTKIPLTFNSGSASVSIAANAFVLCDPVNARIEPGSICWYTTWYKCGLMSTALPTGAILNTLQPGGLQILDATLYGDVGTLTNQTINGNFDTVANGLNPFGGLGYSYGYHPVGIFGYPHPDYAGACTSFFVAADSIGHYYDDITATSGNVHSCHGWQGRWFGDNYPSITYGVPSGTSGPYQTNFIGSQTCDYIFGPSGGAGRKFEHLIDALGINNLRFSPYNASTLHTNGRLPIAAHAVDRGATYTQTTLSVAGYGWLSGGQPDLSTFHDNRKVFNDDVRANSLTIPGCIGYLDPCLGVENDPVNSDDIGAATAYDGSVQSEIHPNSVGHQLWADAMSLTQFTANPNPVPAR